MNPLSFFKKFPGRFGSLIGMLRRGENWGDVKRSTINYIEKKYQLRPALSLCRNWGYDGSGEHCSVVNSYSSQEISSSKVFEYEFELRMRNLNHADICTRIADCQRIC